MDKKQKTELGVGTVFLVFGMYVFYEALKLKGKESLAHSGAFFPLIIASIIILLSIVLAIKPIGQALSRAEKAPVGEEPTQSLRKVGIGLIILIVYPLLVPRMSFLLTTFSFLAVLMYFMKRLRREEKPELRAKAKEVLIILFISFVVAFSVQILFGYFFMIPLP
jgi:Sec-independent protein secretion pathway component TatC